MEDSQPKRAIQRVLSYIERNPLVIAVAILCATLLSWKLISVAAESPYRYETLKRYHPSTGRVVGEDVYRIDDRTGELQNLRFLKSSPDKSAPEKSLTPDEALAEYVEAAYKPRWVERLEYLPFALLVLFGGVLVGAASLDRAWNRRMATPTLHQPLDGVGPAHSEKEPPALRRAKDTKLSRYCALSCFSGILSSAFATWIIGPPLALAAFVLAALGWKSRDRGLAIFGVVMACLSLALLGFSVYLHYEARSAVAELLK